MYTYTGTGKWMEDHRLPLYSEDMRYTRPKGTRLTESNLLNKTTKVMNRNRCNTENGKIGLIREKTKYYFWHIKYIEWVFQTYFVLFIYLIVFLCISIDILSPNQYLIYLLHFHSKLFHSNHLTCYTFNRHGKQQL